LLTIGSGEREEQYNRDEKKMREFIHYRRWVWFRLTFIFYVLFGLGLIEGYTLLGFAIGWG
jgi:hypothetical protein